MKQTTAELVYSGTAFSPLAAAAAGDGGDGVTVAAVDSGQAGGDGEYPW